MSEGELSGRTDLPYFTSPLLFNGQQRQDVARLSSFLQTAMGYVNGSPQRPGRLDDLIARWQKLGDAPMRDLELSDQDDNNMRLTKQMARLKIIYGFDIAWVDAFLVAKAMDAAPKPYKTIDESLQYVHGSAEVIGHMVASILRLSKEAHHAAALQGRALQWLGFLRDIAADAERGRQRFPQKELKSAGLPNLSLKAAQKHPDAFRDFVHMQLNRYHAWQREAGEGLPHVPRRAKVAASVAADVGKYVAKQIAKDPFIVYEQKVTPPRSRLILSAIGHSFD